MDLDIGYIDGGHRQSTDSFILENNHMRSHRGGGQAGCCMIKKGDIGNKNIREIRGTRSTQVRGTRDTMH